MKSSSFSTLRLLVHPVEPHGSAQVSGSSRIGSGPERLQSLEDVPTAGVVGLDPVAPLHLPGAELPDARPGRHVGAVEREVFGGPDQRLQLDERPVHEGAPQLCRRRTTNRGGSTRPGPRSARPRRSGRAGGSSDAAPDRATRRVVRRRAAALARRSDARRSGRADGRWSRRETRRSRRRCRGTRGFASRIRLPTRLDRQAGTCL